jgi:hypothetical protein
MTADLDPEHAETRLLAMEGDAFHRAGEGFGRGGLGCYLGHVIHDYVPAYRKGTMMHNSQQTRRVDHFGSEIESIITRAILKGSESKQREQSCATVPNSRSHEPLPISDAVIYTSG